ncbi:hypothetical protein [Alistipes sp.]|uniref:hypothetical protein n=1 Tax=Alistipes sp. TaxID=1872444 RepID=UPI003AB59B70
MIKRIIGLLFVAAAIAVIVLTVLDRNAYTSLVRTNGATQAGAAAMDGSADGNTADVGNMNSTGGMDSRRPAVSAGADGTAGGAGSSRPAVSAGADGDTGRADGSAPESGVVPASAAPDSAVVQTSPPVEADTRTEGGPASRTDNR